DDRVAGTLGGITILLGKMRRCRQSADRCRSAHRAHRASARHRSQSLQVWAYFLGSAAEYIRTTVKTSATRVRRLPQSRSRNGTGRQNLIGGLEELASVDPTRSHTSGFAE